MNDTLEFKRRVVAQFIALKERRIAELSTAQKQQLDEVNIEDIDFADPVEGTKSMLMDEVSQQSSTIDFLIAELALLNSIRTNETHTLVTIGSLIEINDIFYLIGATEGQFNFEGKKFVGISTSSPFFQEMKNLATHSDFRSGVVTYKINAIL
jgi:hypothetical protein